MTEVTLPSWLCPQMTGSGYRQVRGQFPPSGTVPPSRLSLSDDLFIGDRITEVLPTRQKLSGSGRSDRWLRSVRHKSQF